MRSARHDEELIREPTVEEALADPVIQAVMTRDRVSRDDVLRAVRAAQARLRAAEDDPIPHDGSRSVVTPFPARAARAAAHPLDRRDILALAGDDREPPPARRCRGGSPVEE